MKYFNKTILNALEPAEEYFRQVEMNYKRNSPHSLDLLVYEALKSVNPKEPKPNYSCPLCIFELYRKCSKIYNYSKEIFKEDGYNSESQKESKRKGKKKRSP